MPARSSKGQEPKAVKAADHQKLKNLADGKEPFTFEQWSSAEGILFFLVELVRKGHYPTLALLLRREHLPRFIRLMNEKYGVDVTVADASDTIFQADTALRRLREESTVSALPTLKQKLGLQQLLVFLSFLWRSEKQYYVVSRAEPPASVPALSGLTGDDADAKVCPTVEMADNRDAPIEADPAGVLTLDDGMEAAQNSALSADSPPPSVPASGSDAGAPSKKSGKVWLLPSPLCLLPSGNEDPRSSGAELPVATCSAQFRSGHSRVGLAPWTKDKDAQADDVSEAALPAETPTPPDRRSAEAEAATKLIHGGRGKEWRDRAIAHRERERTMLAASGNESWSVHMPFRLTALLPRSPNDMNENVKSALLEAERFMKAVAECAKEIATTRFGATEKNWEDEYVRRSTPQLPCDQCDGVITLSNWPGCAWDGYPKEGWCCATCAKLLADAGRDHDTPPVLWCSAKCKKLGQSLHCWPKEDQVNRKDRRKADYCRAAIHAKVGDDVGPPCSNPPCGKRVSWDKAVGCSCGVVWYCGSQCFEQHLMIHMVRCRHTVCTARAELPALAPAGSEQAAGSDIVADAVLAVSTSSDPAQAAVSGLDSEADSEDLGANALTAGPTVPEVPPVPSSPEGGGGMRPVCVVCLENDATHLGRRCGHLAWCKACRRKAVHLARGCKGSKRELSSADLERTPVECPVCRQQSCLLRYGSKFIGGREVIVCLEDEP